VSADVLDRIRTKIFADAADLDGIMGSRGEPHISGFTTNPTLMWKAGLTDYEEVGRRIPAEIDELPISFEVFADKSPEMRRQAERIATCGDNVYVKIPVSNTRGESMADLAGALSGDEIKVNITAVTLRQVAEITGAVAGGAPSYLSVFAGRIADAGVDLVPIMREALEVMAEAPRAELIWASPRELLNLVRADAIGCHVITMTHDLLVSTRPSARTSTSSPSKPCACSTATPRRRGSSSSATGVVPGVANGPMRPKVAQTWVARLSEPLPAKRDTTPTWLLPGPIRRLRLLLRQARDLAAETHRQVIEARAEQNAGLARLEVRLQEIAGRAAAPRDPQTDRREANGPAAAVKLFTSVSDDLDLFPHFLRHYAQAGVTDFFVVAPSEVVDVMTPLASDYAVTIVPADPAGAARHVGSTEQVSNLRRRHQQKDEWVVIAEADEFVDFPKSITEIAAAAEAEGANVVRGTMYDRFTPDGHPSEVEPASDLAELFPVRSRFIRDVMRGWDQKAILVKGLHTLDGEHVASTELIIDRYKWIQGSVQRQRARARTSDEADGDWRREYDPALRHYDAHGRFAGEKLGGELCLPEWEFVPEGWARSGKTRGWRAEEVARAYREKWPQFLEAVEGPGPLGVGHETPLGAPIRRDDPLAQNAVLAWAYVLARASHDAARISVLDWGGALGHHSVLARKLFPELELDYHCRELPAVCTEARQVLPDVTFHDDDRCLGAMYDVVLASNSLQYDEDWASRLEGLAGATRDWLFVTRVPVVCNHPSFVVLQRAYRYGYATEYLGWALSRQELLDVAGAFGLALVREFALLPPYSIDGAPDTVTDLGFLFSRSTGDK
jgi:transaldolase